MRTVVAAENLARNDIPLHYKKEKQMAKVTIETIQKDGRKVKTIRKGKGRSFTEMCYHDIKEAMKAFHSDTSSIQELTITEEEK
jgi:hypothetical protein